MPVRPVEELKDFQRLTLDPGETRTVKFALTPDKLEAYDIDMRRTCPAGRLRGPGRQVFRRRPEGRC